MPAFFSCLMHLRHLFCGTGFGVLSE